MVGQVLKGRYEILEAIGEGGMGTAWLAEDRDLQRRVVVKAPKQAVLLDPQFRVRFEREVKNLLGLDHPHVTRVLDADVTAETPFLVLPWLSGGSLEDRLSKAGSPMSAEDVLAWLPDVSRALDFIHKRGFVHRDVKPGNVMFDGAGIAFLGDFGIARAVEGGDATLTQTGMIVGSPKFLAPEVAAGHPAGPASDQYALATVVYLTLSGQLPHAADTPLVLVAQKVAMPPRPLQEAAPRLSGAVAACVMRALSRDPADRFASCEAFATAFAEAVRLGASAPAPAPPPPPRRRRSDRATPARRLMLLVALLLVAIIAYAAYFAGRRAAAGGAIDAPVVTGREASP